MYRCHNPQCGKLYESSNHSNKLLPKEHILACPYCGNSDLLIGADEDTYYDEKDKLEKVCYNMYSWTILSGKEKYQIIIGRKVTQ